MPGSPGALKEQIMKTMMHTYRVILTSFTGSKHTKNIQASDLDALYATIQFEYPWASIIGPDAIRMIA